MPLRFISTSAFAGLLFAVSCSPKQADSNVGKESKPTELRQDGSEAGIFLHAKVDSVLNVIQGSDSRRIAKSKDLAELISDCKLMDANQLAGLNSSIDWLSTHQTKGMVSASARAAYDSVETKTLVEMQEALQAKSKCDNGIILSGLLQEIQLADDSVLLYRLQHDNYADAYNALDSTDVKKAKKLAIFRINP